MPHTGTHADPGGWPVEDLEYLGRCPLCDSDRRNLVYAGLTDRVSFAAPGLWSLYRCGECDCVYLDPRPTRESIGRAYKYYYTHDRHRKSPLRVQIRNGYLNRRYGHRHANARAWGFYALYLLPPPFRLGCNSYARHLRRPPSKCNRLLDIGCGNGDFIALASSAGWVCEGIDPDTDVVSVACARGLRVTQVSVDGLDLSEALYDVITMSHVIEHMHDPLKTLQACHKLLRPGGLLWIATPNLTALGHQYYRKAWRELDPPRHLVLFDQITLRQSLIESGFRNFDFKPRGFVELRILLHSQANLEGVDPAKGPRKRASVYLRVLLYELLAWLKPHYAEEVIVRAWKAAEPR